MSYSLFRQRSGNTYFSDHFVDLVSIATTLGYFYNFMFLPVLQFQLRKLHYKRVFINERATVSAIVMVTEEEKIEGFHKVIEKDNAVLPDMSQQDLIYYTIGMDHFLQSMIENDATFNLKMHFGK